MLRDLTVGAGAMASFAAVPTFAGTLTIASTDAKFALDSTPENGWYLLATAADGAGTHLYGNMSKGTMVIFR